MISVTFVAYSKAMLTNEEGREIPFKGYCQAFYVTEPKGVLGRMQTDASNNMNMYTQIQKIVRKLPEQLGQNVCRVAVDLRIEILNWTLSLKG